MKSKQHIPWKNIIVFAILIIQAQLISTHVESIENTQSAIATLYENTTFIQKDTTSIFQVTLLSNFIEVPLVYFGISGYQGNDPWRNQLTQMYVSQTGLTYFKIHYQQAGPTTLSLITISYFTTISADIFEVYSYNLQTFTNISSGSGQRFDQITRGFLTPLTNANEIDNAVALNGFWLRSENGYNVSVSVQVPAISIFTLTINVNSDTTIQKINIIVLFIKKFNFPHVALEQYFATVQTISHTPSASDHILIKYSDSLQFMMGLSGIIHNLSTSDVFFYWERNQTLDYINILSPDVQLQSLIFTYLVIGKIVCNSYWSVDSVCVDGCSSGQTSNPSNRVCSRCASTCLSCSLSEDNCQNCIEGYSLSNTVCQQQSSYFYLLALLGILPVTIVVIILIKRRRVRKVLTMHIEEHPSIQL